MPRYQALHVDIQLVPQSQNSFIVLLNSEMRKEIPWSKRICPCNIATKHPKKHPPDVECVKACSLLEKILEMNLSMTFVIRDEKNLVKVKFEIFLDPNLDPIKLH